MQAVLILRFRQGIADVCINQWPNCASLRERRGGRQSYHTGTYFSHLEPCAFTTFKTHIVVTIQMTVFFDLPNGKYQHFGRGS